EGARTSSCRRIGAAAGTTDASQLFMTRERLQLRLPERCVKCGALGSVRLESTITGHTVALAWCCHACSFEWPTSEEERERPEESRQSGSRRTPAGTRR